MFFLVIILLLSMLWGILLLSIVRKAENRANKAINNIESARERIATSREEILNQILYMEVNKQVYLNKSNYEDTESFYGRIIEFGYTKVSRKKPTDPVEESKVVRDKEKMKEIPTLELMELNIQSGIDLSEFKKQMLVLKSLGYS